MAKVTITTSQLLAALSAPGQPLDRGLRRAATKVVNQTKRELTTGANRAVDTGRLRASINYNIRREGSARLVARVGTDVQYGLYVHKGRGTIVPKRAKVLVFTPKRARGPVFAQSVGPVKAKPYLTDALRSLRSSDFGSG